MKKHHKLRNHLSSSDSSPKKFFVKALNAIGFYSTKWSRLLSCEKTIKPTIMCYNREDWSSNKRISTSSAVLIVSKELQKGL